MTAMLGGDEELCRKLIPDQPLGFRRMTPSASYLLAMRKPNVEVTTTGIRQFVPEGIELESGEILQVDAIVCATGFETSFQPRFELVGRNGNLRDTWRKTVPKAYMSCAVPDLPNYFSESPLKHQQQHTSADHRSVPRPQRPHRPRQRLHR